MKKAVWSGVIAAAGMWLLTTPAYAQVSATGSIGVTATVGAHAKLTLGAASITWTDQDPDSVATLTSASITIDVKARTSAAGNVTLTVKSATDLTSGSNTIPIGQLTWAASGTGFTATGASNKDTAQTIGSWTGSTNEAGAHTYSLPNSWTYATGSYTATLTYTLTAP